MPSPTKQRDELIRELCSLWESGAQLLRLPDGSTVRRQEREADLLSRVRPLCWHLAQERKQAAAKKAAGKAKDAPQDPPEADPSGQ